MTLLSAKKITLADVAVRAGVSSSAVSVALSQRSKTATLKPETRARILKVVRELDYRPDARAKGLVSNKSFLVALLARQTFDEWVVGISRGIEQELRERSYSLLSYVHGETVEDEIDHLRLSLDRRVDGILVMPALEPSGRSNAHQFDTLKSQGVPIVQLFNGLLPGIPMVRRNLCRAARLATRHLLDLGHRRILHLTHERYTADRDPIDAHLDARLIHRGYAGEMIEAELEPRVLTHPVPRRGGLDFADEAAKVADDILALPDRPTAVVAYADYQALGLMRAFHARGVRLPRDMSIVGHNNIDAAQLSYPSLTTTGFSQERIGQEAARMLLKLLNEDPGEPGDPEGAGGRCEDVWIEPDLYVRESTAPPPSR